jgi:non-ribosomal peptide synthetase-like protein
LRALGARIGRGVHLHRGADVGGGWDLVEIGAGATLGRDCSLGAVEFHERQLVLAPVHLGAGATLDTRAHVAGGARIEPGGFLGPLSLLAADTVLAPGERWEGVPAARVGPAPVAAEVPAPWPAWPHALALVALRGLLSGLRLLPGLALAALCLRAVPAPGAPPLPEPIATLPPLLLLPLFVAGYALSLPVEALAARALGRVRAGTHALRGWTGIAASLKDSLVDRANAVLSGTLLWPLWLRAAGARVGHKCEISTIMEVIPELLEIGDECFFADGIYLGRPLLHRGTITCAPTRLSSNTFLGNHVVVPAGAELPPDILLGICTVADPARIRPGTSWFGLPAFELPRREVSALERDLTHDPTWPRVLNRVCFEWVRLALPLVPALLAWGWFAAVPQWRAAQPAARFYLLTLPLVSAGMGAALCALAIAVKWLVLGPIREGRHALWSCWCCRWDLLYEVWAGWAGPVIAPFEGTPLVSWWLRAMGCRIGRGVVFGSAFLQVVDPDMLVIEDGATVACHLQSHSFEDRVLKLAPVRIGAGSTVGRGAVLLYGADIGAGASVGDNSIVMKHESLLPHLRYVGCPTRAGSPAGAPA